MTEQIVTTLKHGVRHIQLKRPEKERADRRHVDDHRGFAGGRERGVRRGTAWSTQSIAVGWGELRDEESISGRVAMSVAVTMLG